MPKYPRLAEEGRVRSEQEYIEWAARVSRDAEDIRVTTDEVAWREHIRAKYRFSAEPELAEKQLDALWRRGILPQWEGMPAVGIIPATRYTTKGYYYQYRDAATGRFTSFADVSERLAGFYK